MADQQRRPSTGAGGAARRALGKVASCDEMRELCNPSTLRGVRDIASDLVCIGLAVAVALSAPFGIVTVLAGVYIGCMQRRLSNLLHEMTHAKLFPNKNANDFFGYVIAWTMMTSFGEYHDEHTRHHALLGTDDDPKLKSYRARGATTLGRDKFTFVSKVILANALWSLPATTLRGWLTQAGSARERFGRAFIWTALIGTNVYIGSIGWFIALWVLPLLLVRPVVNMVTDMINHLGIIEDDVIGQTRGFTVHPIVRHLISGHHDDSWHPVHHLLPKVQHHRLEDAMRLIVRERPEIANQIPWCSGLVWRRHRTPNSPSVLEHIVMSLHSDRPSATGPTNSRPAAA